MPAAPGVPKCMQLALKYKNPTLQLQLIEPCLDYNSSQTSPWQTVVPLWYILPFSFFSNYFFKCRLSTTFENDSQMMHGFSAKICAYKWAKLVKHHIEDTQMECKTSSKQTYSSYKYIKTQHYNYNLQSFVQTITQARLVLSRLVCFSGTFSPFF